MLFTNLSLNVRLPWEILLSESRFKLQDKNKDIYSGKDAPDYS